MALLSMSDSLLTPTMMVLIILLRRREAALLTAGGTSSKHAIASVMGKVMTNLSKVCSSQPFATTQSLAFFPDGLDLEVRHYLPVRFPGHFYERLGAALFRIEEKTWWRYPSVSMPRQDLTMSSSGGFGTLSTQSSEIFFNGSFHIFSLYGARY